ncbi:MAG: TolC family protein [Bacteroidales bacterium]|nr:TolC family protein [Bacteroidales bacterium]
MKNVFLEQSRRDKTHEVQVTPHQRSAVWSLSLKAFATVWILLLCLTIANAQSTPWTLDQCVQYALDHNLTVKQSELAKSQREVELNTAKNSVWPALQANASQNFSFGRGLSMDNTYVSSNTANTSFGIGGSMNLFTGLRVKNNIEMGKLNLEAANADCDKTKEDIRTAVMQAYVQILYNMEICKVAQSQIAIDSVQVVRLELLAENGKVGPAEVAARKATLAQSRLTYTQALNNLKMALLDMTQLLELPSPEGFSVVPPDVTAFAVETLPDPEVVYNEALATRAAVKAEEIRLDYAQKNIALAKSTYYPTLSMNGGLVTDYYALLGQTAKGFGAQLRDNFSPYLGFSLNVPIFDRLETRNQVRAAKLQYSSQELQMDNVRKSLYKEIQQAYYNAVAAMDKYESSRLAAESAQEAFELAQARYENGKGTGTEFNEAKNNHLQAASNLVQAQYEYLYQKQLLELYRGK